MKLACIALFASLAAALSVDLNQRASPLAVAIKVVENSVVQATVTNNGKTPLKVLQAAAKVHFDGLRLQVATSGLTEDAFKTISPGQTISVSWDVAEVHDLSAGGAFDVLTTGTLSYAEADSTELTGSVPFTSNVVTASIDGPAAVKVRRAFRDNVKRTIVQSDCTGTKLTTTRTGESNCRAFAAAASTAALSGPAAKMVEYFKSSTTATRNTVAGVFNKVATECGSTTSGVSKTYCSDVLSSCSSGVLAYTLPSSSLIVNCPLYFSALPAVTSTCHAQDQATCTLHETTHLTQIKGTTDQGGCYGYSCVQSLTASQNLNHADTYALFANAIHVGC
ncbi:Deuterolysin metalloprotease family-domain-containing protein [Podospora appendiculata]|uniref:Neutral protease 2 n=1 Tax=Podospora appendiculata TaxID=314037 RepID=A0AAE1CE52_9PEZI|nr:Deuterolysin metalloprotease family-domain-containing protein [Podospora appendiculata]